MCSCCIHTHTLVKWRISRAEPCWRHNWSAIENRNKNKIHLFFHSIHVCVLSQCLVARWSGIRVDDSKYAHNKHSKQKEMASYKPFYTSKHRVQCKPLETVRALNKFAFLKKDLLVKWLFNTYFQFVFFFFHSLVFAHSSSPVCLRWNSLVTLSVQRWRKNILLSHNSSRSSNSTTIHHSATR